MRKERWRIGGWGKVKNRKRKREEDEEGRRQDSVLDMYCYLTGSVDVLAVTADRNSTPVIQSDTSDENSTPVMQSDTTEPELVSELAQHEEGKAV